MLENIPDVLYKYRDWTDFYQKKILTENQIYLAAAIQFNDPFDASLPFKYREQDLTADNLFVKLYESAKEQRPDLKDGEIHEICYQRQMSGVFEDGKYWKDDYLANRHGLNSRFGILSLTSKNNNLLMWSNYAKSHQGFCVGFDKFILYELILGHLGPIEYSEVFPEIGLFEDGVEALTKILTTKSVDWRYEDEYRVTKIDAAKQIFEMPPEILREVILGFNMPEDEKDDIVSLVKEKFPQAKIYQSNVSIYEFKVEMIPIL